MYAVNGETNVTKWEYTPHDSERIEGEITQNTNASGFRLPTVEEWRYAAKGGEDYKYAGSDNLDEVGWSRDNSDSRIHPVAQKKPNGYGLYDMSGNVREWAEDYEYKKYNVHTDYPTCGGDYGVNADYCEVGYVYSCNASVYKENDWSDYLHQNVGFRLVYPTSAIK